jgi:hypothetical protein
MYKPTTSRTLSTNWGSSDSLKVSVSQGLSPNACHIRPTDDGDIPTVLARSRVDQCVASMGLSSSVRTITASTSASLIERGAPGRGSSTRPSRRRARNRLRHLTTVAWFTPTRSATALFDIPSAANNTIRARWAIDCGDLGRRDHPTSASRSALVTLNGCRGRPRSATPQV